MVEGNLTYLSNSWAEFFQLLTSQQLSCSAAVSSGSAMGSMMQHMRGSCSTDEAMTSGSVMGKNIEGNRVVDEWQQQSISSAEDRCRGSR